MKWSFMLKATNVIHLPTNSSSEWHKQKLELSYFIKIFYLYSLLYSVQFYLTFFSGHVEKEEEEKNSSRFFYIFQGLKCVQCGWSRGGTTHIHTYTQTHIHTDTHTHTLLLIQSVQNWVRMLLLSSVQILQGFFYLWLSLGLGIY